jgi:predicted deacylase
MSLTLPSANIDVTVFPESYCQARDRWLKTATALHCATDWRNYACPGLGPDGETLYTGTLWIGPRDAQRVLVVTSATHGIEGFAGSAIQFDLLELLRSRELILPEHTALLVVHALNPWGYAWQRRCDAQGVDLNRNFVDFGAVLPQNPGYDALRWALFCPDAEQRRHAFAEWQRHYGRENLECAISGGQFSDPHGPFYGGQQPAHGRKVLENIMQSYKLASRRLAVIDLHTGLGPYGYGEIICDHAPDSDGAQTAYRWYGDAVTLPALGTSSSVPKLGLIDYAWHAIMDAQSCFITLEFGTFSTERLFEVVMHDHLLWAEASANEALKSEQRAAMRRHFCPVDTAWREMLLFRARQVIIQAINGLNA